MKPPPGFMTEALLSWQGPGAG